MRRSKWVALLTLAFALTAGSAQAQTKLRYQFKEGDKLDYVTDQKMKMSMSVGGKDIEMKFVQSMDMQWAIGAVDSDGNARVKMKFGRVKMTMDSPMGNVEIDSDDKKEPEDAVGKILAQVVTAVAGMEMDFTMTPAGKLKDVKIPAEVLKKLKNLPGADAGGLGNMLSEDGLKNMVQGNLSFPEEAIEKGKTWDQKQDIKMPFGTLATKMQYTYQGAEKRDGKELEKIGFKTKLSLEPDPKSPLSISMKGSEGQGRILFDNKKGRLIENTLEQTMQMTIDLGGMMLTQNINQETTVRLKNAK